MAHSIYTVRAKSDGEVIAHCISRTEFLRHVIGDPRTRNVFSFWGEHFGIDAAVNTAASVLDALAQRSGLAHRSALKTADLRPQHLGPMVAAIAECEHRLRQVLDGSQHAREHFARAWVVEELFRAAAPAKVPMRAWLVRDLMTDFDVEVWAHVWGDTGVKAFVSRPPTLTPVPKGQRPKGDAEHLRRNVTWFYRARIATPNVMIETLAEEYREEAAQTGRSLGFRDATGVADRPDTKLVRHGVADAERLLSLTIPPELWTEFRTIH